MNGRILIPIQWTLCLLVALLPVAWALNAPLWLGLLLYPEQVAGLMLGLSACTVYLRSAPERDGPLLYVDLALAAASLWVGIHILLRFPVLSEGAFFHPEESLALGVGIAVVSLEGLRRLGAWSLIAILGALVLYALFSDMVPGKLQGRPIPAADIVRFIGVDSAATLGSALQVAAFVVVLFIVFGRLLVITGGAGVLTDAARALAGEKRGATAKMAVIASAFMGSISGSAVSNVMSTGVVTIPAMKKAGFKPKTAGAIEAVASTGGQILPPVMGAAAFLMSEFLQMPYRDIIIAALIPALLYFYAVYVQITLLADKHELGAGEQEAAKPAAEILRHAMVVIVPIGALLTGMFAFNMEAERAVVWASIALLAIGLLNLANLHRISLGDVARAVYDAGRDAAEILLICAVAGMIIGLLSSSGLSFGLSFVLLQLGQDSLLLLLLLTAAVSIILGMGLPTSGVYLLLATLSAPPLVQLGIGKLEAHFFVFYFGLLSMISPPVALASFAAASMAGAKAMATAWESVRLGWIAFVLPFVFVYHPGLLMQGTAWEIAAATVTTVVAVPMVTAALLGFGRRRLNPVERLVAIGLGALCLLPPGEVMWMTAATWIATAASIAVLVLHTRRNALPGGATGRA
ncbi:TRAP transporter fused permease subunit [Albimonas sp. CAU 1670]|uniref:TRAP transporter permease n=1 Tax=Albimonas sp. CAU 1670 TaxID=3032599 RepID=UPI0023DB0567|nr:TRAP transporter fused permease subunit [Albimonas sp. CAU 1670]MDF2231791.1 TRAP transporter fused permease subunit [Albimonas sp. CAU 1670]